MKYLSLFSGIGGFELGIIKAHESNLKQQHISKKSKQKKCSQGGVGSANQYDKGLCTPDRTAPLCIGYSEIDKYATQIYEKHFPQHKKLGDVTKIIASELPDFDLLVGGFPCQAFSIAGKRRGFDDTRGTLFFDIARILKEKRPRNFILENVKGLLSHDNGRTFKTIITTLVELGYCVEWQVLNAKNFGVPQNRERVFIVGHFGGIPERKVFPIQGTDTKTNQESSARRNGLKCLYDGDYQSHRVYDKSGISPTIPTSGGGHHIPFLLDDIKIRRLTPLECERLMGYPDGWTEGLSDTQRYKTLGNGIVSNVVEEVVKKIYGR